MAIFTASRNQDLQKRVLMSTTDVFLLVIAHPDDECMFFIPTIVNLLASTTTPTNTPFYILCLSNGNYHGLGKQREKEFYNAIQILGLDFHKVTILSDFLDNPLLDWNVELLSDCIYQHIKHIVAPFSSSQQVVVSAAASEGEQHQKRITIITFDSKGVSGHRNHCSTYRGVKRLLEDVSKRKKEEEDKTIYNIRALFLKSMPLWIQTYIPLVYLMEFLFFQSDNNTNPHYWMISNNVTLAWKALACHKSQFVWYRKLSVLFSRYTFINMLVEE